MAGKPGRSGGARDKTGPKQKWHGETTRITVPKSLAHTLVAIALALQEKDYQKAQEALSNHANS